MEDENVIQQESEQLSPSVIPTTSPSRTGDYSQLTITPILNLPTPIATLRAASTKHFASKTTIPQQITVANFLAFTSLLFPKISPNLRLPKKRTSGEITPLDTHYYLECPTCFENPRCGPLFFCTRGHYNCNECRKKLVKCPICINVTKLDCRNLLGENLLARDMEHRVISCCAEIFGCNFRALYPTIEEHENICLYRSVECADFDRVGSCHWKGPLPNLVTHMIKNNCSLMVTKNNIDTYEGGLFHSLTPGNIQDIFTFRGNIRWRPIFLFSPELTDTAQFLLHLVIARDANKLWRIYIKGFATADLLRAYYTSIIVSSSSNDNYGKKPSYTFIGNIISENQSEEEIISGGQYLLLSDDQVENTKNESKLFKFYVRIEKKGRE
jgi:hypothetical protein